MSRPGPSLKSRALRLLSQREHSRAELQTKLQRHVQEGDDLNAVLQALEQTGWINEERVAESLIHRRAGRLGTRRVLQELRAKGLDEDLVQAQADRLRASEAERALAVWQRRFGQAPDTPQDRARQMRFLAGRGFDGETVRKLMRAVQDGLPDPDGSDWGL